MESGIRITSDPNVIAVTIEAVMKILECHFVDNATKQAALDVLGKASSVDGTSIHNCTFTG